MRIAVRLVSSARRRAPLWVVVLAFLGGPAASQDGAGDWYAKLFGGATFPQAEEFEIATFSDGGEDGPLGVDSSFDTGWLFGVAVGRRVARRVGVELEFAYRSAHGTADDKPRPGRHRNIRQTGTADSRALLLNVRYDLLPIGPDDEWQPYVGMGLGAADLKTDEDSSFRFPRSVTRGAGLSSLRGRRIWAFAEVPGVRRAPLVRGDVGGVG